MRGHDGTWLLTGTPAGAPDAQTARFIPPRRVTLQRAPAPNGGNTGTPTTTTPPNRASNGRPS